MDCLEGMKQIDDNSVDLIVTDPPYYIPQMINLDTSKSIRQSLTCNNCFNATWDCQWESLDAFKSFIKSILIELKRVLRYNGQCYFFMSYNHLEWIISLIKEVGFRFYRPLIWYKPDIMGMFPNQYGFSYEVILWFRKESAEGFKVTNHIGCSQRDVFKYYSTLNSYRKECG
jgi:DNA modification methylase